MRRSILGIFKDDIKRITDSVVSIILIMGLCIVPCLYAWFNILSNWDPYTPSSTGRIAVAVVNEDEGADILGLPVNVGEKITEGLRGTNAIGWKFVGSSEKALDGLYAGKYYAAVTIPEDFSSDVLSFTSGELTHPELDYYENEKKNAIAPKITNKAQMVLQEQVNAAFIETIGKYVSEADAIANASGIDPQAVFADLGDRIGLLSERMDDLVALVTATQGLSDAANSLLKATGGLSESTQDALSIGENVLNEEEKNLPKTEKDLKKVSDAIQTEANTIANGLEQLYKVLSDMSNDMDQFNQFVLEDLEAKKKLVSDMADSAAEFAEQLSEMGLTGLAERFSELSTELNKLCDVLDELEVVDEVTWPIMQEKIREHLKNIKKAEETARSISEDAGKKLDKKIDKAIKETRQAIREIKASLNSSYGDLNTLNGALAKSETALKALNGGLDLSIGSLLDMQSGFKSLSELFNTLADSDEMKDINYLLSDGTDVIAENLASPIKMRTETIYPVKNFGSMMASFYTILSQWVCALFAVVLISAKIRRRPDGVLVEEGSGGPRLHEMFFGRYRLFAMIGIAQALLVSLGDLLYLGIQCHHPFLFVLAACVNGLVFTMINFALSFALEKIGLALSVIILLMQVAGSGGTFPPEVLPGIFQKLYPVMPFHYSLNAMRECIAGMYGNTYIMCIGILLLFGVAAIVLGLLLAKPGAWIASLINRSLEKSDLMES